MKIGEKGIDIKDLADTIKCNRKVIEHIRKREAEDSPNSHKNKLPYQEQITSSEKEKCLRTTLVKTALFTFCSLGLGKPICESYDTVKDEEKKLGRKLSDDEVHKIVIDTAKRHNIIPGNHIKRTLEKEI